jgi:hypothetical protein
LKGSLPHPSLLSWHKTQDLSVECTAIQHFSKSLRGFTEAAEKKNKASKEKES